MIVIVREEKKLNKVKFFYEGVKILFIIFLI